MRPAEMAKNGAVRARDVCVSAGKRAGKRSKKGVVYFVTSDKVIQSMMTGSVVGAVSKMVEGWGAIAAWATRLATGVAPPPQFYTSVLLLGLFYAAWLANENTEEWREWVADATGEETADDDGSTGD